MYNDHFDISYYMALERLETICTIYFILASAWIVAFIIIFIRIRSMRRDMTQLMSDVQYLTHKVEMMYNEIHSGKANAGIGVTNQQEQ